MPALFLPTSSPEDLTATARRIPTHDIPALTNIELEILRRYAILKSDDLHKALSPLKYNSQGREDLRLQYLESCKRAGVEPVGFTCDKRVSGHERRVAKDLRSQVKRWYAIRRAVVAEQRARREAKRERLAAEFERRAIAVVKVRTARREVRREKMLKRINAPRSAVDRYELALTQWREEQRRAEPDDTLLEILANLIRELHSRVPRARKLRVLQEERSDAC